MKDLNTPTASAEGWYPMLLQAVHQGKAGPIARTTSPNLNMVFGDATMVSELPPSGGCPGIEGLPNTTNLLVDQRSASSAELEHVGR